MKRRVPTSLAIGVFLIGLLALGSAGAPWLTPHDPLIAEPGAILEPPSVVHWAGTDQLGRDLFARMLYGGRASLVVAFGIVAIGLGLGVVVGCASALAGGWIDGLVMRTVEVLMSIPGLVIALAASAALGPSLMNLVLVLGALSVPYYVRLFRVEALAINERGYVRAARTLGADSWRILWRHLLPNLAPTIATFASMALAGALVTASALSFIGLGAQPPQPEWGALIYEGRNNILYEWWCAVLPGTLVATAALGFILIGDGLRDFLDPRAREA